MTKEEKEAFLEIKLESLTENQFTYLDELVLLLLHKNPVGIRNWTARFGGMFSEVRYYLQFSEIVTLHEGLKLSCRHLYHVTNRQEIIELAFKFAGSWYKLDDK